MQLRNVITYKCIVLIVIQKKQIDIFQLMTIFRQTKHLQYLACVLTI